MDRLGNLYKQWEEYANELIQMSEDDNVSERHKHMDMLGASINSFGVGQDELKLTKDSYVRLIEANTSSGSCCWTAGGWLQFEDEIDYYFYLYCLWFISGRKENSNEDKNKCYHEIEKHFKTAFKDDGSIDQNHKRLFEEGVDQLWMEVSFGEGFYIHDLKALTKIILEDLNENSKLHELTKNSALDPSTKEHLEMIEEWMGEWGMRY